MTEDIPRKQDQRLENEWQPSSASLSRLRTLISCQTSASSANWPELLLPITHSYSSTYSHSSQITEEPTSYVRLCFNGLCGGFLGCEKKVFPETLEKKCIRQSKAMFWVICPVSSSQICEGRLPCSEVIEEFEPCHQTAPILLLLGAIWRPATGGKVKALQETDISNGEGECYNL
ncbi:hypothetical protein BDZ45DRAFT_745986 [Acephala macrosclerotiorum]|nr:hypothetical protein BDZ45DRAFT_745986 [Acephala macrosclerotiorum]